MTTGWWIEAVVKVLVVFVVVLTAIAYVSFLERRILAHMQSRIGPNRVGPQGLFQPAADALKAMTKETILPEAADRILFLFAPVFSLVPALMAFAVIPFGSSITLFGREVSLHITDLNVAVLYILALSSIGVYGIFLGGWASNNKYALIGGLRSSAQMISYELTLGLVVVAVAILAGSFSLVDIVNGQQKLWNVVYQPLGFVLFLIGSLAEINRTPFDLPEAETELVAGYHTEYSGMRFAMFVLFEYANLITVNAIAVLLFFGGWLVPFPSPAWAAPIWFSIKVMVLIFFMMWTRGTLPRFRFDQLMNFGWKFLLPLALANILGTAGVVALLEGNDVALVAFVLLAVGAIGGALAVVLQRNALYGALSLVGVFAATAGLYLTLSAPFLAVIQVIVYAGAIMVLFIFVIMLLSLRYEESGEGAGIPRGMKRTAAGLLAGVLVALLGILSFTLVLSGKPGGASGDELGSVQALGLALYRRFMFPFEVASLLLLVAIIGAVAITRRHGRGLEGHVTAGEDT